MSNRSSDSNELIRYINLKLTALGQPAHYDAADREFLEITKPLLRNYQQKDLLLAGRLCPVDTRIQAFLDEYLAPWGAARLPNGTFVLDRPGMARALSIAPGADKFESPYVHSYRVAQGVLHNPRADRRTTEGIFHVVEGGIPVPADKFEAPRQVFANLLREALRPPEAVLALPFTADQDEHVRLFVSLLLRPIVCPATGTEPEKRMEIRFFAPGSLVSNLDFVEGIFGNGGDPYLPENNAALDVFHWTGHTGCVILAPHIVGLNKKALGLPHFDQATERQRRDGMCWRDEGEAYNGGRAFKMTARNSSGVTVTIIADNYYGYCKKEVKTQISFSANLSGLAEEEHAGGAIAFPSYVLGQEFYAGRTILLKKQQWEHSMKLLGERVAVKPEGYAVDRRFPDIFYVPGDVELHVNEGVVRWRRGGETHELTLRLNDTYVMPSGYRIRIEKQIAGTAWRLIGIRPDGTLIHKPCTVSGGGKSEISKSIANAILKGPVFVRDYHSDMDQVAAVLKRDFTDIFKKPRLEARTQRPILSLERSLGSVIKLLTASPDYTDEYNQWLRGLSQTIRQLVFTVKRYYLPEWGEHWREHFTVDRINGYLGHELKFNNQKLLGNYLRVGFDPDGSWRIYKLRPDFNPAAKVQVEDDITASVTLPRESVPGIDAAYTNPSVKLLINCEALLFQRPDEAIHRGFDRQAEQDIATPGTFLSNYQPLTPAEARKLVDHVVEFDEYTDPMKDLLKKAAASDRGYVVSSAHPRLVDGKPSKNPRYLQRRPDLVDPKDAYLAEVGARLYREIPSDKPVHFAVNAVMAGRRGNPPDPKIGLPPLAVYNPIHYQELPELFMDFVSSLTGKSPSTTGFGSEGALTKGPFNSLPPVVDLNNALASFILTGYAGFTTSAGSVGPSYRVDHDISLLVPEIWCRMQIAERDPAFLIQSGYLEKLADFDYAGRRVLASRLGYRITGLFAERYLGRIFENPDLVFSEEMLCPEKQDLAAFVAGVDAIVETQRRVAQNYFEDGSIENACPPLKAILYVMAEGQYNGMTLESPTLRDLFRRETVVASDWYQARLRKQQQRDVALWTRHVKTLEANDFEGQLAAARERLAHVSSPAYLEELNGTIGADPCL